MFIINHKSHKINSLHETEESAWKNICTSCNHKAGRKNHLSIQMTPKQRRKANALIRKFCCNYDGGNCIALDDGEPCVCIQSISYSLCCTWFRDWVLPGAPALQAEITSPKDWSNAQNVVRRSLQSPTAPSIVLIVPARYTAVRKQQVTGNGGRIRTNRASKSRIYAWFPAWQSWKWIAIPLIAQKSRSNCPHGGTCHGYKTLLHSSEATGPKFYTTAQFSVWGTKFLLLVKRSQTVICDDPASNGFVPQKRLGRRLWKNLSVLHHQWGVRAVALWPSKSGGHADMYPLYWTPSRGGTYQYLGPLVLCWHHSHTLTAKPPLKK